MTENINSLRNGFAFQTLISYGKTIIMCMFLLTTYSARASDDNLQISGTLVAEPCELDVNNNTLTVDFGTVIAKTLYKDLRTPGIPLTITLTGCDISVDKTVKLTLNGQESSISGYLATTGVGSTGVAIGIETLDGTNLPVNKASPGFALQEGTTLIALQAYVEAEPDAIRNHTLIPGEFTAIATIDAEYP